MNGELVPVPESTSSAIRDQQTQKRPGRPLSYEERFAIAVANSSFFSDIDSASRALVKIQAGKELGIGPATSLRAIQIIGESPCISANTMMALVDRAYPRYDYDIVERSTEKAEIRWYREGTLRGSTEFTVEEARTAQLLDNPKLKGWKHYRKAMLFARAFAIGFRLYCGALSLGGTCYTPDELGGDENKEDLEVLEKAESKGDES
jgi:hypothetical protein